MRDAGACYSKNQISAACLFNDKLLNNKERTIRGFQAA